MYAYYFRNTVTGEQACLLGHSIQEVFREHPEFERDEWVLVTQDYED